MECSCNGCNKIEKAPLMLHQENEREYQFLLNSEEPQPNLTINQLSKWEHHPQPVPDEILQVRTI